jgi:protein involved in sex pheromone biosynthesis
MKNIIFIAALATSILFASCNSNKTETHGEETEHHDEHENDQHGNAYSRANEIYKNRVRQH